MNPFFDPLKIRMKLGRKEWKVPVQAPYVGLETQWWFDTYNPGTRLIVSAAPYSLDGEDVEWLHASISHRDHMPSYEDLAMMYRAVFNDGWAYQIFAPESRHVNFHSYALHLWGRVDGKMIHPDFQKLSGINMV